MRWRGETRDDGGPTVMLRPALAVGGVWFEDGEGDLHQAASWQIARQLGRGTPTGHCVVGGQFTENHNMMESYLRAVNDAPPSIRSKKRQSPAARREIVTGFILRAVANAAAQANM
ncbi:hypothetical protein [Caulobacter sp. DWR3-1-2]|uniref:hypothetical protein n=1 Tax=Caulobacter sp. DWR3-1-2 TaxID=2804647 RepID=UPI003CFB055C